MVLSTTARRIRAPGLLRWLGAKLMRSYPPRWRRPTGRLQGLALTNKRSGLRPAISGQPDNLALLIDAAHPPGQQAQPDWRCCSMLARSLASVAKSSP